MRAFWIVVFGSAGFAISVATASASKVEYSEKELDGYCYSHAGIYKTDRENYWSCEIGSGKSTVHIDCNKAGKCVMYNESVFTQPRPTRGLLVGKPAVISSGNVRITAGASRKIIAVSPLKQLGSTAATASTTITVTPAKLAGSGAAAGASPIPGAAVVTSGRATLRQP
jgi:hypothetical protein